MKLKILFSIFLFFSILSFAQASTQGSSGSIPEQFAGTLVVNKTAPSSVNLTDQFTVTIEITNSGSYAASGYAIEYLGNVEPISPQPIISSIENESVHAAQPPMLVFNVSVSPGSKQTLTYTIKPKTVGSISIGPTQVIISNSKFYSNSLFVQVECTSSSSCDEKIGETPLNCPSKCGAKANETVPQAPQQTEIYTEPFQANADPLSVPPDKSVQDEINGKMLLIAGAVILVLAIIAYLVFFRKK